MSSSKLTRSVNAPSAAVTSAHIPALDGIRALAILLVIPYNVDVLSGSLPALAYPAALLIHTGWIGVQLFFVLSGFLITGTLLDTRQAANYFSVFFGRRALRILPLYFVVLSAAFVVAPLVFHLPERLLATEANQLWLWTFLSNWTQPYDGSVHGFTHFWSLAVEEQFYLLWPFVVLRCTPASLLRICGVAIVAALLGRAALAAAHFPPATLYMFTLCRMDALALGAAAAALLRIPNAFEWLKRSVHGVAIAAIAILIAVAIGTRGFAVYNLVDQTLGYTAIAVAFALFVLLAVLPTAGAISAALLPLSSTPLRLIGRYSYAMYVFHLPLHVFFGVPLLHRLVGHITPSVAFAYAAAMILVSFAAAAVSYELFERHFLRFKNRLAYNIAPASTPHRLES